jgi:DNA-binding NarL/FixJ family response regulator
VRIARSDDRIDDQVIDNGIGIAAEHHVHLGCGIALIQEVRRLSPPCRDLVLTVNDLKACIRAALLAGADGFVLKDVDSTELLRAIRTVSRCERYLDSATASKVSWAISRAISQ